MKLRTLSILGVMALSLVCFCPASFAQNPNPATGGTVAPAPSKDAPAAPGAPSVSNAESEANGIASRIEQARKEGKDVSKAETEEKQGEAALQAGYKSEAAQHFERANAALGTM